MKLFSGKSKVIPTAQLRSGERHPFTALDCYVPLGGGETEVYRSIREAVPVIDAAVMKLVRLAGGFTVECKSNAAQRDVEYFLSNVNVGRGQRGLEAFIAQYLDSMLTFGRAVGEIVTDGTKDIAAVVCGNIRDVQVREGASALDFELCSYDAAGRIVPLPYQELLLFTPLGPEPDSPYGVSMLRSMPYDGYEISFKEVKTVVDGEKQEQFPEQLAKYYTVQSGDTFGVIANRNGLALDQLVKLNPQISNIHLIYAGQILRVG